MSAYGCPISFENYFVEGDIVRDIVRYRTTSHDIAQDNLCWIDSRCPITRPKLILKIVFESLRRLLAACCVSPSLLRV